MGCSACGKRTQGRIVPVSPTKKLTKQQGTAAAQGSRLRDKLRYTGR